MSLSLTLGVRSSMPNSTFHGHLRPGSGHWRATSSRTPKCLNSAAGSWAREYSSACRITTMALELRLQRKPGESIQERRAVAEGAGVVKTQEGEQRSARMRAWWNGTITVGKRPFRPNSGWIKPQYLQTSQKGGDQICQGALASPLPGPIRIDKRKLTP